jgi:hypothetical protein
MLLLAERYEEGPNQWTTREVEGMLALFSNKLL